MLMRSTIVATLAAGLVMLPACAKRTDQAMRRAWESSAGRGTQSGTRANGDAPGENGDPRAKVSFGWARVDEILVQAIELLDIGPDDSRIARLAERWCAIEPAAHETVHGPVFVCHPSPAVSVEGHTLVLELGAPGVIGLVARDLSEAQSLTLSQRARKAASRLCTGPWAPAPAVTARDGALREEFHTCTTQGGPMLAVGRTRVRSDDDNRMERGRNVWQVSVAVLGTT
jgi:hypothetical protein